MLRIGPDAGLRQSIWREASRQVQGTVENALRRLAEKIEPTSDDGEPTGEELFAYQPKSFLVVGRLDELRTDRGINIEKYRSFELYRRHTQL